MMEKQKFVLEMAKDICRVKLNCNDVCNPISACDALKYAERAVEAEYCATCPSTDFCKGMDSLMVNALALINRQKKEIERLNAVHADMTESLRLAAEANKDMSVELDAMRGAANSYKMHYEEVERKYQIATAEREANVKGFTETLNTIKAEAIKEFAERLKNIYLNDKRYDRPNPHTLLITLFDNIDNLVKEMTK